MSRSLSSHAALPLAHAGLRGLIVLNWIGGVLILALLVLLPNREWIMSAFKLAPSSDADQVIMGMRAIAGLGLVGIPLNYLILKWLLAVIETVRAGDPFVPVNANRLRSIAWALLGLQLVGIAIGAIAKSISTPAHPIKLSAGFSVTGWLAVLLIFVLARVFDEGTLMREDLEGMV